MIDEIFLKYYCELFNNYFVIVLKKIILNFCNELIGSRYLLQALCIIILFDTKQILQVNKKIENKKNTYF